jgi:hypothetical protein
LPAAEVVNASKVKVPRAAALALARSMSRLVLGRGKKVITIDMTEDAPDDDALAELLLGRTGNLKAPTLKVGTTLLVGYSEAAYREVLGI